MLHSNGLFYHDFNARLCKLRGARRYLEIGVQSGLHLAKIEVEEAIAIDPAFQLTVDPTVSKKSLSLHRMTSDAFFADNQPRDLDFAFIDGMHQIEYILRDLINVEQCSTSRGIALLHDCLPFDGAMIAREDTRGAWTGDVWKIVPILEKYRPDLLITLVDAAPTGIVAVSRLDPSSRVLVTHYTNIVAEALAAPNDGAALEAFYAGRTLSSAESVLARHDEIFDAG